VIARCLALALLVGCGAATPAVERAPIDAALVDPDRDRDGLADAYDVCPCEAEDVDGFEDGDGCPDPDDDHDGIADACDRCPNEPETYNGICDEDGCPDTCVPDRGPPPRIVILERIAFARRSAVIPAADAAIVRAIASAMLTLPELTLVAVIGSVDGRERRAELPLERARVVVDALVALGVARERLVADAGAATDAREVRFEVRTRDGAPISDEVPGPPPTLPSSCEVPACTASVPPPAC
jgi:hypothetical protein